MALNVLVDGNDRLIVLHVSDPSKDYLPEEFLPKAIHEKHRLHLLSHVRNFDEKSSNTPNTPIFTFFLFYSPPIVAP